ncbi:hypothetical protein NDU88_006579 [Pleurodeles waltl]|uniref:Uncharacterized protein n=1 Tax=Pleurodeles waltl TaxID=8319 RepID=A0AAV7WAZ4_PLEWA|nr:hypothetical protein NDU88_006579 [Pleurodeles waltl]
MVASPEDTICISSALPCPVEEYISIVRALGSPFNPYYRQIFNLKTLHSSTEKAITRQGAEESSCKQVCCQIEDPARSQAGQDSVRLSRDIEFQQLDPRAIQKQIAAASGLFPDSGHNNLTDQFHCVGPHETLRTGKVAGVRHQVATGPNSVYVVKMSLLKWLHKDSASQGTKRKQMELECSDDIDCVVSKGGNANHNADSYITVDTTVHHSSESQTLLFTTSAANDFREVAYRTAGI